MCSGITNIMIFLPSLTVKTSKYKMTINFAQHFIRQDWLTWNNQYCLKMQDGYTDILQISYHMQQLIML